MCKPVRRSFGKLRGVEFSALVIDEPCNEAELRKLPVPKKGWHVIVLNNASTYREEK